MPLTRILFDPGTVVSTDGALAALQESGEQPDLYLDRHTTGDWGELRSEEETANLLALGVGGELFSRYRTARGDTIAILTGADRSTTHLYLDNGEGERMEKDNVRPDRLFGSFTTAIGFALGELLVLTGTSDDLPEHLREINVTARATIISSEAGSEPVTLRRQGVTLSDAALRAARAWSADPHDPADLDDTMAVLAEVLEEMGMVRMVSPSEVEVCEG